MLLKMYEGCKSIVLLDGKKSEGFNINRAKSSSRL